ncbi:unnamed protein product [Mytilus edulis]|uniref:RNase H type-1 domain-containing protein n=1 Tax=Mytilus edulis TaxID=6550 RepID=A0A8S3QBZ9_MYTED|nr:unnamed protein product [Mytilus edulis]
MDDLRQQVLDLTGAELQDLLQFANRDNTVEEARWATHCLILYANEYGQPSGQDLTQSQDQTPNTSANPVNVQMSGDIVQSSGDNNNNGTNKRKRDDLEDRIATLENTTKEEVVKNLKEKNSNTLGSLNSFNIHVPEWEMESGFNPEKVQVRQEPAWVTLGGEIPSLTTHVPSAEEVLNGACGVHFDSGTFPLRDPDLFLSGQIHHHLSNWKDILVGTDDKDILKWLINGVDATDFSDTLKEVDLRTLQRFSGKCISMQLAVPGCKLFCREVNAAISVCTKCSRPVRVFGPLKEEIEYWKFLDKWEGFSKWRPEFHNKIDMVTDSSGYRYGALVNLGDKHLTMGDYWLADDTRPIHEKEAEAILKALQSLGKSLLDSRVDVLTDSMAVIGAWNSQGSKCPALNCIMKDIFQLVAGQNVDLHLSFVPSELNKADGPSRILNTADTMLSNASWVLVDSRFGPHTVDLMSLDSNVMQSVDSRPLRHFTPWLTPETSGVNVFSQDLKAESNMYVYPPYVLIFPLLCFLKEQSVSCTVVVPELYPVPMWWPMLTSCSSTSILLGARGQKGVVKAPSRKGFVVDEFGLRWPLWAFRVSFS